MTAVRNVLASEVIMNQYTPGDREHVWCRGGAGAGATSAHAESGRHCPLPEWRHQTRRVCTGPVAVMEHVPQGAVTHIGDPVSAQAIVGRNAEFTCQRAPLGGN